jgi:predicted acylesterase/phospholipase RssA
MSEKPDRYCDLVMKGGITSGVVYPKVVEEVAKRFHLVGVAGTSAGAIAASLAAAAEYKRRKTGSFEGFTQLAGLGEELARPGRLLGLFTPDKGTRKLFELLLRMREKGLGFRNKVRLAWILLFRREKTLGALRDNSFGLCSGMANDNRQEGRRAPDGVAFETHRRGGRQEEGRAPDVPRPP